MTPDAAHHPVFAVAEAACLVLAIGALAERAQPVPRLVQPLLIAAAFGMAVGPAALAPAPGRVRCAGGDGGMAAIRRAPDGPSRDRRPRAGRGRAARADRGRAGARGAGGDLRGHQPAVRRARGDRARGGAGGLLAASLPAPAPTRLLRLGLPGAGLALLAASLPGVPAALLVMPVLLPLLALLAGGAILGRIATLMAEP